jgi:hypothetical protein
MKRKIYAPVTEFERQTSYCPLYLAWRIVDEARDYFRTSWVPSPGSGTRKGHLIRPLDTFSPSDAEKEYPMGEGLANKLARRAEAVFARHPNWARKATPRAGARQQFECRRQCEFILKFMRHWLAGELARERPALFRDLPESFKIGHPLPQKQGGAAAPPYHKTKTVGLTCRSARTSQRDVPTQGKSNFDRRARSDAPYLHFTHGCELLAV